jgi:ketosteroid isomerase-like protein
MRNTLFLFALLLLTSLSVFAQQDMKADIMAAEQKFMTAFQQGATTMGDYYTSDAQMFPPNSDVVKGTAAISTFWKGGYDAGIKRAKLETMEAEKSGDQVIELGRYTLYGANDAQIDAGKYIVVWKKERGQWKLYRDIWNTSAPASMPAK